MRRALLLASTAALLVAGSARAIPPAAPAVPAACALLTASEIEKTQSGRLVTTRETGRENGSLLISQCFYSVEPFASSVSLEVTASASRHNATRERWERVFHRDDEPEVDRKSSEDEEAPPATSVAGLADEAYWVQGAASGVLYVLDGDVSLRVSVGGQEGPEVKARKSRALATLALGRLKVERAAR